jgi:hypothetical protein
MSLNIRFGKNVKLLSPALTGDVQLDRDVLKLGVYLVTEIVRKLLDCNIIKLPFFALLATLIVSL